MDKNKVIEFLKQSQVVEDIEEIEYKPEILVLSFFYDYDDAEIEAAKDFANGKTSADDSEDIWYDEHFIPYIIDIAVDEVRDTLEELVEKTGLNVEYINYEPDRDDDSCEFIAVFADEGKEFDIDKILDEIDI
jgi:hypothetical protein